MRHRCWSPNWRRCGGRRRARTRDAGHFSGT
jgi:hypothetical protein